MNKKQLIGNHIRKIVKEEVLREYTKNTIIKNAMGKLSDAVLEIANEVDNFGKSGDNSAQKQAKLMEKYLDSILVIRDKLDKLFDKANI